MTSTAKLSKSIEKVIIEVLLLYMFYTWLYQRYARKDKTFCCHYHSLFVFFLGGGRQDVIYAMLLS